MVITLPLLQYLPLAEAVASLPIRDSEARRLLRERGLVHQIGGRECVSALELEEAVRAGRLTRDWTPPEPAPTRPEPQVIPLAVAPSRRRRR